MWCRNCNIETNEKLCPICGIKTEENSPIEIHWCANCGVPIIFESLQPNIGVCPHCNHKTEYMSSDLRPVFPEERLLLEILLDKAPNQFLKSSVWASCNRYYIDGKSISLSSKLFQTANANKLRTELTKYKDKNSCQYFDKTIKLFVDANKDRHNYLKDEAFSFIQNVVKDFEEENLVVSFSGGKDSTVTADLVANALSFPSIVHIFGDTTLEFPMTLDYANRYRSSHPKAIFKVARNYEQNFIDVCKDIGPPARMMRWCCSMFKTGPITRVLNNLYHDQNVLTFYGIRKFESVSRSKYNRIEDRSGLVKIQKQTVASPIFFWKDIDVWLYILSEGIDFNNAYRLGYDRVGCWCCPNNSQRAQFLSRIYLPEQSKEWRNFLIDFARQIGKIDAEVYVDTGKWKARQGGNGLVSSNDVKIRFTNCTTEDNAKIYRLVRPFDEKLINMFVPFGVIAPELGSKLLREVIILDTRMNVPIMSLQPFSQNGYDFAVKVRTMNVADHDNLQRMISYQIRKFNACRKCLKCESLCRAGAISIIGDEYNIDPKKCVHCKMCVTAKFLDGGCMMDKYLRTK